MFFTEMKRRQRMQGCLKINNFLNVLMGSFVGAFIGSSVYKYLDYKNKPDLYAMQSAPWYTGIQVTGIALIIILVICIVIKLIIRKKMKR